MYHFIPFYQKGFKQLLTSKMLSVLQIAGWTGALQLVSLQMFCQLFTGVSMTQLTYNFTTTQHWVMERSVLFAFADPRRGGGNQEGRPSSSSICFQFHAVFILKNGQKCCRPSLGMAPPSWKLLVYRNALFFIQKQILSYIILERLMVSTWYSTNFIDRMSF